MCGLYGDVLLEHDPALAQATRGHDQRRELHRVEVRGRRIAGVAYHYGADPLDGRDASSGDASAERRPGARSSNTLVPAQGDQPTVFVNRRGRSRSALTVVNPEKGAGSNAAGAAMDP